MRCPSLSTVTNTSLKGLVMLTRGHRFARIPIVIVSICVFLDLTLAGQEGRRYSASRHGGNYMVNFYLPPAPSSTPWAPAWAPDGRSVAAAMSGSIWKIDIASGAAEELTYGPKYHSSPDWSADGKWIVYTADDGGKTIQLEILNVATGETHALTHDAAVYADPAFSPDGSRIAYVSSNPNGYFNVFIRTIQNGQWAGPEIAVTRDHDFGRDRLYFGNWDMHLSPAWLPDGNEMLIVTNRDVPLGSGNVVKVPAAPDGIEKARVVLAEQSTYRAHPSVSADGKRFVYSSTRGTADEFDNLYVQPTTGGEPYKLTFFSHDAFAPRWSPDGEWIAYVTNAEGLPQLALLETYGGEQRTIHITERRWKRPMGTLSVRTVDADTDQPTAARIHLTASDGKFYAPPTTYARVNGMGDPILHTDGDFTIDLPVGKVSLVAVKGFEFSPERAEAQVDANGHTRVTLRLRRMTDMAARGWHNGSMHVHTNYAGNMRNTLENVLLMTAAEGADVANALVANKDNRVLDRPLYVKGGGAHPLSTEDRLLVVGEEYRPPFYGHVSMLGLKDHLISPWTTGYEGTAIESLYPSNTDMLRKAKAQGATVTYVHAFGGERDPLTTNLGGAKAFIVDAALGATDAVEWSGSGHAGFFPWYAVLNNGLRIPAVAGEDSITSLQESKMIGSARTYVYTGERGLTFDSWFENVKKGRSFITMGPLTELSIDGVLPGGDVRLPAEGGNVDVSATVRSITPLDKVQLVFNGAVVKEIALSADRKSAEFHERLPVKQSGWYHLRAEGSPTDRFPLDANYPQAFTNPIWVAVGDRPVRNAAAAEYALKWIDTLQKMAEAWPGWRSQKERDHVFAQFEQAREVYRKFTADRAPSTAAR
jgi:Tol biopolymer transport system component